MGVTIAALLAGCTAASAVMVDFEGPCKDWYKPGGHTNAAVSDDYIRVYDDGCELTEPWAKDEAGRWAAPAKCLILNGAGDYLERDGAVAYFIAADGRYWLTIGRNSYLGWPCE